MGFCFLNGVAIAARDLVENAGATRVLIADFDVHHGNGTQDIFWEDGRVAYLSVHRSPFYPYSGAVDEEGEGKGRGTTRNVPIAGGASEEAYVGLPRGAGVARRAVPASSSSSSAGSTPTARTLSAA
jgi:acetoin utilization deacetylase AcuC-like enzyme